MRHPSLFIDKSKLARNIGIIQSICGEGKIGFCAVTKCFTAAPEMVEVYYSAGIRDFADTRILNLNKIKHQDAVKWLLRLPQMCEIEDVVRSADISLNSEAATVEALSVAALRLGKRHKIILMVDVGDLREGVLPENAVTTAMEMQRHRGVELYGVGVNYNCFGGVIPTVESLRVVTEIAAQVEEKTGTALRIISGGNSGTMHLLTSRTMPTLINNLRLGEIVLFGRETSYRQRIRDMHEDVFRLDAQIIELKNKPSMPIGEIGLNAFGEAVVFEDKGNMLRAIVACGRQDVDISKITPLDRDISILGQSSDHMILDLTHSRKPYKVGDILSFSVTYGALLSLFTSEYVSKVYHCGVLWCE